MKSVTVHHAQPRQAPGMAIRRGLRRLASYLGLALVLTFALPVADAAPGRKGGRKGQRNPRAEQARRDDEAKRKSSGKAKRKSNNGSQDQSRGTGKNRAPDARRGDGSRQEVLEDGRKIKAYSFGVVDLEGQLKTPQLLYFLNRVKLELDSTTQARRSFIKELEKTGDEKGL